MKRSSLFLIAVFFASEGSALTLVKRANPSVLGLDIQRRTPTISAPLRDRLRKRDPLTITLDNEETLYFANITLGTPGQQLRLDIDTGSSDIWTNAANSNLCEQYASQCAASGTFNANKSSSYQYLNSDFYIKYADNSYAQGDYATDVLSVSGTSIANVPFGIGYQSTSVQGIMGVGYKTNEASVQSVGSTYNNFPLILTSSGVIKTPAYSLWLNDLDANSGSILFGGVDTDKFHGNLATLPIIQEQGEYREFIIALTGLTVAGQTIITSSEATPVLLDSGSSLSYLPTNYANAVFQMFNAQYSNEAGAAVVSCSYMTNTQTFDFSFSGMTISVSMNEMVIIDGDERGREICILGISDAGDSTAVLGDTFLRSAYVVYDLDSNTISLAATDFNATSTNIEEIAAGASGVPSASTVNSAVTSLAVSTGGARSPQVTSISQAPTVGPSLLSTVGILLAAVAGVAFAL